MNSYKDMDSVFNDIRPYRDHEVNDILKRLIESVDFEKGLQILMGKYISFYSDEEIQKMLVYFKKSLLKMNTVREFQNEVVVKYMLDPMIKGTIDSLTGDGFQNLSKDDAYLFIGNHRDITLDPALLNYFLMQNGFESVEIAFGDNLLINDFLTHIIRINKSFIVKRNLPLMKQLEASIHLSKYIFHTISNGHSVWLAQREGRAKDGNDFTNPAIISMLYLSQRDGGLSLTDYVKKVKIVPVSVSYEYDPCDRLKALEILRSRSDGESGKKESDDIVSMNQGITGYKGRVHYAVSKPLELGPGATDKDIAAAIDREIQLSYHLWPSNYIAFDELLGTGNYSSFYSAEEKAKFDDRLKRFSPEIKTIILEVYANPVKNREAQLKQ